jgi:hypothetical protein
MPIYSNEDKIKLALQAIENSKKKSKETLKCSPGCKYL